MLLFKIFRCEATIVCFLSYGFKAFRAKRSHKNFKDMFRLFLTPRSGEKLLSYILKLFRAKREKPPKSLIFLKLFPKSFKKTLLLAHGSVLAQGRGEVDGPDLPGWAAAPPRLLRGGRRVGRRGGIHSPSDINTSLLKHGSYQWPVGCAQRCTR